MNNKQITAIGQNKKEQHKDIMTAAFGESPRRSLRILSKRGSYAMLMRSQCQLVRQNDPSVEVLIVNYLDSHIASDLVLALDGNTNVKTIWLMGIDVSVATARMVAKAVSRCRLKNVHLAISCSNRKNKQLRKVMAILYNRGIANSTHVTHLMVKRQIGNVGAMMDSAGALRSIGFHMPAVTDEVSDKQMDRLCFSLREKAPLLTKIKFESIPFGADRIQMLSRAIVGHPTVRLLSIGGCYLEDEEAKELVREWDALNCRLVALEADYNSLSAIGVIALLQANARCGSLRRLKVKGCYQIDDLGLLDIAGELIRNTQLTWNSIDVSDCIPDADFVDSRVPHGYLANAFTNAMRTNRNIFELIIHGNGIAHGEGESQLRARMELLGRENVCARYTLFPRTKPAIAGNMAMVLWCHILEKYRNEPTNAYWHIREQPGLFLQPMEE
jgi:hypothetical protein